MGRPRNHEYRDALITMGIGAVVGIGLRRRKGDAFESNLRTQLAMQVGLAVGYFLVADRSTDEA